jgi:hypothetical protein
LIDLERGALIDSCFSLTADFAVPDLLYKRELAQYGGPGLLARGLRVVELTREELMSAQTVRRARPALSLPDAYAYSLASSREWTLLTGDGELRSLARAERVPFVGVLWLLDQLFDGNVVAAATLVVGLEAIAAHPRCRLPRTEIQARLERYGRK